MAITVTTDMKYTRSGEATESNVLSAHDPLIWEFQDGAIAANPTAQLVSFGKGITEKQLHYIFRDKRISGEWYDLNEYDVISILSLLKPNQDN